MAGDYFCRIATRTVLETLGGLSCIFDQWTYDDAKFRVAGFPKKIPLATRVGL